jgi:transcriptional regulator with XRE-family HTH domain
VQINTVNAALGKKVAEFRKAHQWSQAQLAEQLGEALGRPMDATAITRLEQGRRPVPVHELILLSRILNVEPTIFFKFLSPLEDVIAALQFRVAGLDARAQVARIEHEQATTQLSCLQALVRFRESGASADLTEGLGFLYVDGPIERARWRELFLDAGIPANAIEDAVKAVPNGTPDHDTTEETRSAFFEALATSVIDPKPRRRKR